MSIIRWEKPPKGGRGRKWQKVADDLKSRPGEWALVAESASRTLAGNISNGLIVAFRPPRTFEGVGRVNEDKSVDVWARYVGPNGEGLEDH